MKKIYFVLLSVLVLVGCSSDSGDSSENEISTCGEISTFNVAQNSDVLLFSYAGSTDVSYYEVSYFQTGGLIDPNDGIKFNTTDPNSFSKRILDMNVAFETNYSFYIRTVCASGAVGRWKGPVVVLMKSFCDQPRDLRVSGYSGGAYFSWQSSYLNESSYYEVQYGLEGFEIGQGTTIITNNSQTYDMVMQRNKVYDFYVRSKCNGALGWSAWAGPVSHVSAIDQNICSAPISATGSIESYSGSNTWVKMTWNTNGDMNTDFEYVIVNKGSGPETGTKRLFNPYLGWPVVLIPTYGQYDFYVRTVCSGGATTAWFGPTPLDY